MKKLNKLFAILFAVLGVTTLKAQTDVTDQYLTNPGFEDGVNGWTYGGSGTHYGGVAAYGSTTTYNSVTNVAVDKFGKSAGYALHTSSGWGSPSFYTQEVILPAGEYKITFDVINRNSGATKITNRFGWVPNSGTAKYNSATDVIYNAWQTISVNFTLETETTGKISVGMISTNGQGSGSVAKLFTDNVRIIKMDEDCKATIANPIDYSDLVDQKTWWFDEDDNNPTSASALTNNVNKGAWPYRMAERYRGVGGHYGKKLYQTINVPAGVYQVQAACMSAHANKVEGGKGLADGTLDNAYFYANAEEITYALANATSSFQKIIVTLAEDGPIEFGVKTVAVGANWNAIGCATVIKVANSYEEYLQDLLGELYIDRQALVDRLEALQAKLPPPYYTQTIVPAIKKAEKANTQETLSEANGELRAILANAESMSEPYTNLKSLITNCEIIIDNSVEFVEGAYTAFSSAVNKAKTDVESAETADAINAVYNTLETARQTYVQQADPLNGTAFDYTFKVTNPGFDNGKTGWESTGDAQNKAIATNKANGIITGTFFENWNGSNFTGEIYQTISNLPSGVYKLKVAAYGAGTNVYANDKQTAVTTGDGAWYEVDQVKVGDGTLKFGIKNENATTWMGIDNASLEYYGFDVATAQSAITSMVTEAEGLVGKPMNAGVASALQAAIDGADATKTTRNELSPMIEVLSKAIANAKTSVADYSRLAKYIEMTKVFTDVNAYETNYNNGVYTADDVETVRQELNVLRFNAASEIFPNKIEVTGWEGSMGGKNTSGQHWDGTDTKYYDNNSWNGNAHSTMTSIELPKGTYVLKAALRSSANTTLTLTVLDQIVNVEGKGDTGYGVDTKGDANFSSDGSYANNNAGRGWEWEFVKFELEETTTVTLKVECNYNGVYGWASFSDITLWMDDETYMTVNGHAINEPLADAKSLVDTKPMGAAENDALKAAIALGENVSTAQELTKAIEDLNTAVANANAWVAAYNEAKSPLVAALERFEADYNKDGVKMSQTAWGKVFDAAKAAAVAKDVTDSYDGFAAAEKDLTDALVEADESIEAYAALETAIDAANTAANGANIGDAPFQRPVSAQAALNEAIATAQAAYDKAEADATKVNAALDEAVKAFNNAKLNAPAEGQRFYMVIDYEGWEHHGKAVTYLAGGRNDAGLYNIQYYAAPNANYAQAFTFTAVEGQPDCYTLSMTDVDGNERYVSTGTVYGGNANQIRTTTDASKALAVKVIATATEGVWNLYNTEANQYIGGQDAGFYTVNSHINFNIVEAAKAEVTLTITDAKWSTLMLPFDAELPEGVVAYSCEEIAKDGVTLTLVEAESLKANTPYLVNGEAGKHEFAGYGLATKDSYTVGLFIGTYVDYQTEADKNIYVLQKNEAGLGFYLVGENAQPWVRAYRCYMTYKGAGAPMFRIGEDETTSIHNSEFSTQDSAAVYDLMGRKVTNMEKGGMYIVNGKKVIVK